MPRYTSKNTVSYDHDKFKRAIVRRGLSFTQVSEEIGVSKNYFSNTSVKRIPKTTALLLEHTYNIKPEDYALDGDVKEEKEEPKAVTVMVDTTAMEEELKQQRGAIVANGDAIEALLEATKKLAEELHIINVNQAKYYKAWENKVKYGHF